MRMRYDEVCSIYPERGQVVLMVRKKNTLTGVGCKKINLKKKERKERKWKERWLNSEHKQVNKTHRETVATKSYPLFDL